MTHDGKPRSIALRLFVIRLVKYNDALVEAADTTSDAKSRAEATSLANTLKSFTFLVTLVIWYDLLIQVNVASKVMQQKDMQLDVTVKILENTVQFLREFRETGFEKSLVARELAEQLDMTTDEMVFRNENARRRRI